MNWRDLKVQWTTVWMACGCALVALLAWRYDATDLIKVLAVVGPIGMAMMRQAAYVKPPVDVHDAPTNPAIELPPELR